jgi:CubicO group peptidase (beta-lactamase class C family)
MSLRAAGSMSTAFGIPGSPDAVAPGILDVEVSEAVAIDAALTRAEAAGLCGVILVRDRNHTLLHKAYGTANPAKSRPMTIDTGFDIGSIVKPMTLAAILRLEEQGKLKLDDRLEKHFPEAPSDKRGITLRQIADHRSGMADVFGGDYDIVTREWLVETAMKSPLLYAPGSEKRYSNSGYSLLAVVIERTTGEPFETFVRREVLLPAGVQRIGYVQAGWTKPDLAVGTTAQGERWGTPLDHAWAEDGPSWNLRGNGGMLATAEELSTWYEALFDGKVLGTTALSRFYEIYSGESRTVGGRALSHAGGNDVFNAFQVSFIDWDVHMTFLTSSGAQSAEQLWKSTELRQRVLAIANNAKRAKMEKAKPVDRVGADLRRG